MPDTHQPRPFPWKLVRQRSCLSMSCAAGEVPVRVVVATKLTTLERELLQWLWISEAREPTDLDACIGSLMDFLEAPPVIDVIHRGRRVKEVSLEGFIRCALSGNEAVPLGQLEEAELEGAESCEVHLDMAALQARLGALPEPVLQYGEVCLVEPQDGVSEAEITEWLQRIADSPEEVQQLLQMPLDLLVHGYTDDYGAQGGDREVDPGDP